MPDALSISELGMINDMQQMDVISHNLANSNTPGFKAQLPTTAFTQLLSQAIKDAGTRYSGPSDSGLQIHLDQNAGALRETGSPLDIAILGPGFFELSNDVETRYSRSGVFSVDAQGRLVYDKTWVVVGEEGEILLQGGDVAIQTDGTVTEDGEYAGRLRLVDFSAPEQLRPVGNGQFVAIDSGVPKLVEHPSFKQGYLEASNVNAAAEMIRMMSVMRHMESTARVMQSYDNMLNTAISTIALF